MCEFFLILNCGVFDNLNDLFVCGWSSTKWTHNHSFHTKNCFSLRSALLDPCKRVIRHSSSRFCAIYLHTYINGWKTRRVVCFLSPVLYCQPTDLWKITLFSFVSLGFDYEYFFLSVSVSASFVSRIQLLSQSEGTSPFVASCIVRCPPGCWKWQAGRQTACILIATTFRAFFAGSESSENLVSYS